MSFSLFDEVYVISHPITGRRDAMQERLSEQGCDWPTFVHADRPTSDFKMSNMRRNPRGEFGCGMSHVKALARAARYGEQAIFLEDDVHFVEGAMEVLGEAIRELPGSWAVLYLGGHPCEDVERISEHLFKVGRFSFAEAYTVNQSHTLPLLEYWCDRIGQPHAMFDRILGEYARDNGGYCVNPVITYQPPGYSYVAEKDDDKIECLKSGWENHA